MAFQHLNTVAYPCSLTYGLPKHCIPQMAVNGTHKRFCQFQCLAITQASARRSANYQPTIWSYDFVKSLENYHADEEVNKERAKKLEEEVRNMIDIEEDAMPLTVLQLIDDIQRLGLAYRFDNNIKKALHRIRSNGTITEKKSLHATALTFRLLRQHGYEVSQDIFKSFMNYNGDFMACLCEDIKGLLSLYEASYLAFKGENIMDDAKAFTTLQLKNLNENTDTSFEEQVNHALELSLHHRVPRLEARWFIDSYSKREDANHLLLELAQLDFNMVQSKHQSELKDMSRWWKSIGLANELRFVRDRLMECFFWSVGMVFEPQFSNCRKGLTKVTALITTIDDVYDVYGSLDELELFTDAVERWDINAVETLPGYMKLCFLALYNTVNEMAYDTLKEQGVNIIPHLTKAWADLCKAFLIEAQWCCTKYTPTFESYFDNGWRSVSGVVILIHAYFLMGQKITKEAMDCLESYHDILQWPSVIFRLCNDLGTSKAELERGETANSILCYMVERGLCEEDARQHMSNLIDETWKKMNKYQVGANSPFAEPFTEAAINLARIAQCTYQYGDGHGAPNVRSKNRVFSLIIEPVATHTKEGKSVFY